MAVKVSGFARLLVALTLLAWGQFSFAEDYYWFGNGSTTKSATPSEACIAAYGRVIDNGTSTYTFDSVRIVNDTGAWCYHYITNNAGVTQPPNWYGYTVSRAGSGCTLPSVYDPATYSCSTPKDCSTTIGKEIRLSQICTYNKTTKAADCPDQTSYQGCKYTGGAGKSCVSNDSGQYICTGNFYGSGEDNGTAEDTCTGESCKPVDSSDPGNNCIKSNGVEMCFDPQKPGCGTVNGKEGCFQEKPGCGVFNGTYLCIDNDKPTRNCAYFNGKQVCFDPKDPTKVISEASSDHPINGGNADGDDTNDPRASTGTGNSSQGSGSGATNQAIEDLGEKLGPKIDKTNSLLDGIGQKIDDIIEGLFGDEFSDSDLGSEGEAKQAGEEAAAGLPAIFEEQQEKIIEERNQEADDYLKALPNKVQNEWFGVNGELVGLNNVLNKVLPTAMGCADYRIPLSLESYSATIVLPVCELTRIKPLLEWVIWMITLVALWKILYSALRQEDVKASKGGF